MKKIVIILSVAAVMSGCGSENKTEDKNEESVESSDLNVDRLKELDKEFQSAEKIDEKKAKEFIALCLEYEDKHKDSKDAPVFLEKGAMVAGAIGKYSLKTKLFDYIINNHPDYPNYNNVLYMQAVCWDTEMKDRELAKKYYLMVKEKHDDPGILESTDARLATIDSLTYDQHVEMLVNKVKNQVQ